MCVNLRDSREILLNVYDYKGAGVLLDGKECSSTSRLGRTRDSAMLMTQSWFDVTDSHLQRNTQC